MALVAPLTPGLRMYLQFPLLNNSYYCRNWCFQGFSLVSKFALLLTAHIDLISVFSSISVLHTQTHVRFQPRALGASACSGCIDSATQRSAVGIFGLRSSINK